jgi:hypothetical protein
VASACPPAPGSASEPFLQSSPDDERYLVPSVKGQPGHVPPGRLELALKAGGDVKGEIGVEASVGDERA